MAASKKSPFRNEMGVQTTKALFYETANSKDLVVYTLKDWDHEVGDVVYPSLYLKYMECNDLTEYEFANKWLDGWSHWKKLCECVWFKPFVERWREELKLRTQAKALKNLIEDANSGSRSATASNKFLVEAGWIPKEAKKPVGRPNKEKVIDEAKELYPHEMEILEQWRN